MTRFSPITQDIAFTMKAGDDEIEVVSTVTMTSPGDPGRVSGPPEDCWPPEPPEFEIIHHAFDDADFGKVSDFGLVDDLALEAAMNADWNGILPD